MLVIKIEVKRWFAVLCIALIFGFFCFEIMIPSSFADGKHDDPLLIVRKFCQHDFNGGRLSGSGFSQIQDIISYEAESGWDSAVVVSDFRVEVSKLQKGGYVVPVKYQVSGFLDGWAWTSAQDKKNDPWYAEETKKEFRVIRKKGELKIAGPTFRPHISIDTALRICLDALPNYEKGLNDDGQGQELRKTIAILKELLKQKTN